MSTDLYREQLLDHYHNPQNFGQLETPDINIEMDAEGRIARVMFEGEGCVISMAASSMLTEELVGKKPEQVAAMGLADIQEMMGGIRLSMGRVKCALLALNAMKEGLEQAGKLTSD